jgi:hypothetical protein
MLKRPSALRDASSIANACAGLALLLGISACAAGRGRAARDNAVLTCPLERVGTVKNFGGKAVDVTASTYPFEGQRRYTFLGSVIPGETREWVLADSILLTYSDPTAQLRDGAVLTTARGAPDMYQTTYAAVEVKYYCRRFGDGPPDAS